MLRIAVECDFVHLHDWLYLIMKDIQKECDKTNCAVPAQLLLGNLRTVYTSFLFEFAYLTLLERMMV